MPGTRIFFIVCFLMALFGASLMSLGALQSTPEMPEVAAKGHEVWVAQGCEHCHTLYGQGGAFAPDLTHIYAMRGEDYLRAFMVNPNAFHPDQRLMPRLSISVSETAELIEFLKWTSQTDVAAGWPPKPIQVAGMGGLTVAALSTTDTTIEEDPVVTRGRALFAQRQCATCHSLEPNVKLVGPPLAGIADTAWYRIPGKSPQEYIRQSILYPSDYVVEGFGDVMQKNFAEIFSSEELDDIVAFLMTLEDEG